jgi:hypothetical protein
MPPPERIAPDERRKAEERLAARDVEQEAREALDRTQDDRDVG